MHISTAVFGQYDGIHGLTPPPGVRWVDHLFFLSGNIFPFFFFPSEEKRKKSAEFIMTSPLLFCSDGACEFCCFCFSSSFPFAVAAEQRSRDLERKKSRLLEPSVPPQLQPVYAVFLHVLTLSGRAGGERQRVGTHCSPICPFCLLEKVRYWRGVVYHTGTPGRSVHRQTLSLFLSPPLTHIPPSFFLSFLPSFLPLPPFPIFYSNYDERNLVYIIVSNRFLCRRCLASGKARTL